MGFKLVTLLIVCSINLECIAGSCLCHVVPNFSCPPPPHCCESGMYTFDECGCCLECAKSELQPCGGSQPIRGTGSGQCAKGLSCLKTCSKSLKYNEERPIQYLRGERTLWPRDDTFLSGSSIKMLLKIRKFGFKTIIENYPIFKQKSDINL